MTTFLLFLIFFIILPGGLLAAFGWFVYSMLEHWGANDDES